MLKIDVFNHIFPKKFFDKMVEVLPSQKDIGKRVRNIPFLIDLDLRFKVLEEFGDDYRQILSLASPPLEALGGPDVTPELAIIANDEMAQLVERHDRFVGFAASLKIIETLELTPEDRAKIFQDNAVQLLKLSGSMI